MSACASACTFFCVCAHLLLRNKAMKYAPNRNAGQTNRQSSEDCGKTLYFLFLVPTVHRSPSPTSALEGLRPQSQGAKSAVRVGLFSKFSARWHRRGSTYGSTLSLPAEFLGLRTQLSCSTVAYCRGKLSAAPFKVPNRKH